MGGRPQHEGELVDIPSAAAEFDRHAGLDQARGLEQRHVVGERPTAAVGPGPLAPERDRRAEVGQPRISIGT